MDIFERVAEMRREEGLKEGVEKASRLFVENLLKGSEFNEKKIASMANVTLAFVKKIKADLRKK
jgi:hypothetical protein